MMKRGERVMRIPLYPKRVSPAANLGDGLIQSGELLVIQHFIPPHSIVFDVGANVGGWTNAVLEHTAAAAVHLFEPVPDTFQRLVQHLGPKYTEGRLVFMNVALSDKQDVNVFYHYEHMPVLSTFYRRCGAENQYGLKPPVAIPVSSTTLDQYCRSAGIGRVQFLKIDTEGGEFDVLKGAREWLSHRAIAFIQFEYGGTFADAGVTLQEVYGYLQSFGYRIYKIHPDGLEWLPHFLPQYEDYQYSNYLAVEAGISLG